MGLLITPVLCLLIGAALSLRFKFIVLLPALFVTLLLSCAIMIGSGFSVLQITISAIAEITAMQAGYVAGAILRQMRVRVDARQGGAIALSVSQLAKRTRGKAAEIE